LQHIPAAPTYDERIKPTFYAWSSDTAAVGRNNQYANLNGTSFAAPLAAGIIALYYNMMITDRNISNDSLIKRIRKTAFSPPHFDIDTRWGYGI
jgi:hypothetical protein